jgi:hypothetical protein
MKKVVLLFTLTVSVITGYGQIYEDQAKSFFSKFKNSTEVAQYIYYNLPTLEECRLVFKGAVADTFYTKINALKVPVEQVIDSPEQRFEGVKISTFSSDDVIAERGNTNGGMIGIRNVFLPGVVFYKVSFLKKKEDEYGLAFKYFVFLNGRWVIFPKPYAILPAE